MKFKLRKKTQRRFNKIVRELNKSIERDDLWRGRFVCMQERTNWCSFEDGSGGILGVLYKLVDKKTGQVSRDFFWTFNGENLRLCGGQLFWKMNDFITKDCNWSTWADPKMKEVKTDYSKLPIPEEKCYECKFI